MTIKILLFLFSKQLFSSFPPENIANCEIIKDDLTDIYSIFSCNSKEIKERDKEITTIKKNKENITIVYLYYQLIHEKNLYFAAAIVVVAVEFFANFEHVYSFSFLPRAFISPGCTLSFSYIYNSRLTKPTAASVLSGQP